MNLRASAKPIALLAALALLTLPLLAQRGGDGSVPWSWPSLSVFAEAAPTETDTAIAPPRAVLAPTPSAAAAGAGTAAAFDPRAAFEQTSDLYAYAHRLMPAAEAGDADARWLLSRVYDTCTAYAQSPAGYARDSAAIAALGLRGGDAVVAARERIARRCDGFTPEDGLTATLVRRKRIEAAESGSLAAEAALLTAGEPLQDDDEDYRRDLIERVRSSRDPQAFSAIAPAMGIAASGRTRLADRMAGTHLAELAWQLAACRLGLDCGPDSALMTAYCANGGICSRDPSQDFAAFAYDAAIPRQGADVVKTMVDSLAGEE